MQGRRHIRSLRIRNLLSYGSETKEIELEPLNVIIGRNASGKSNFIEAIRLLRAAPTNFAATIREGGGIAEWLWKGTLGNGDQAPIAEIEAVVDYPEGIMPLRYRLGFTMVGQGVELVDEVIENEGRHPKRKREIDYFYRLKEGQATVKIVEPEGVAEKSNVQLLSKGDFSLKEPILAQRRDPHYYPEITYLEDAFEGIRLYGELNLGPETAASFPQRADFPDDFLLENASNLGLVLDDLDKREDTMTRVIAKLKEAYGEAERITVRIRGGTVQVFIKEKGLSRIIPANRLSDGTLRYLCLLTILCHPTPPPLVCIEEPELGLHPDILPTVAELLIEASQRTQLIVTTHSDVLVSALSDTPEAILVCERDSDGTHLRRLEPEPLKEWLEKYSLGELWRMGEIGGS